VRLDRKAKLMAISAKEVNELRQKTGAGIMDCKRALQETDGDIEKAALYLREKGMASAGKKASRVAAEGKVEFKVADDGRAGALAEVNCETDFVARGDDFQGFCAQVVADALASGKTDPAQYEDERKDLVAKTGENVVIRRLSRFGLDEGQHGKVEAYQHMGGKIGVMVEVHAPNAEAAGSQDFLDLCRELAMHVAAASPQYLTADEVPSDVVESEREIYRKQALEQGKPEKIIDKMVEGRLRKWFAEFCLLDQPWVREQKQSISALLKEVSGKVGGPVAIGRFVRYQLGEGIEKKQDDLAAEVQKQIQAAKGD
jgi:elongation factor Ts